MTSEISIIQGLHDILVRDLNDYTSNAVEGMDDKSIVIDFPEVDNMRKPTMIFLQPNWANYEPLTYQADQTSYTMSVFIVAKKASSTVLQDKVFALYDALYRLLKTNNTLDSLVAWVSVESMDYYPALTADASVKGIEVSVQCVFEKDWSDCSN